MSQTDLWETPQELFNKLNEEFGFEVDVCAISENAKCARYFTPEQDGLTKEWRGICWMNPPYGRKIGRWMRKAYESAKRGATVVCLVPARTDTAWFQTYILPYQINMNRNDIDAWAAGIIDGEGCVFIRKSNPTEKSKHKSILYNLGLKVTMTHFDTVKKLKEIFRVGHIHEQKIITGSKPAISWTCYSNEAAEVFKRIYKYSITKKCEIFMGIEFSQRERQQLGRKRVDPFETVERKKSYLLMRELKKGIKTIPTVKTEVRFIRGRLKFGEQKNSAPFPSAIVIFRPNEEPLGV